LAELLADEASLEDCIQETTYDSLFVLPAGPASDQDAGGVDWSRLEEIVEQLKAEYELLVFDLPAADELSPGLVVAALLDGVLMVVEAERTDGVAAARAKRQLEMAGAKLLGVVLNKGRW
jgi:Mrp family chromosome partitioning ATPase